MKLGAQIPDRLTGRDRRHRWVNFDRFHGGSLGIRVGPMREVLGDFTTSLCETGNPALPDSGPFTRARFGEFWFSGTNRPVRVA